MATVGEVALVAGLITGMIFWAYRMSCSRSPDPKLLLLNALIHRRRVGRL